MSLKFKVFVILLIAKFQEISLCPVYMTISLNAKSYASAHLVVNWGPCESSLPTWIGVYDINPFYSENKPLHYEIVNGRQSGRIETNIKVEKLTLPAKWNLKSKESDESIVSTAPNCLKYFIVGYNSTNHVQNFDCLKMQPEWMSELSNIHDIPLKKLYIPGTHCSGCYLSNSNSRNQLLRKVGFKQNFDIWMQLVLGVRYLQFSVGYDYNRNFTAKKVCNRTCDDLKDRFWVMSENYKISKIYPMLQDIRKFVELSKEIVILDFRAFPLGFFSHPEHHVDFMGILHEVFADIAYLRNNSINSYDLTIKEMKKQQKYLLITYNFETTTETDYSKLLWPSWKLHSTEYLKIDELAEFMRNIFTHRIRQKIGEESGKLDNGEGWIFEGIQGIDGSFEQFSSVITARERAERINTLIVPWLGGPWSASANVVLLDFFMSTNLVDVAIFTNSIKQADDNNHLLIIGK